MSRAKRVDTNHADIVATLRRIPGCSVMDLSAVGSGCPDIAVGFQGRNFLIEIKDGNRSPSRRKLTPAQVDWHNEWMGQAVVVKCADEALGVIGI